jgi:hypothetical protein
MILTLHFYDNLSISPLLNCYNTLISPQRITIIEPIIKPTKERLSMNKLLKNSSLALILLITTFQIKPNNPPSYWQIFITWIPWNQQPQENPNEAPAGVTIDDYITQFHSDLRDLIPSRDMQEMETNIRAELYNINLRDKDKANQIMRSIIGNQVRIGTNRDLDALRGEGFYITPNEKVTIPNSYEQNVFARLNRMPHLNGEAIAQYFGETRKESIRNSLRNRTSYH